MLTSSQIEWLMLPHLKLTARTCTFFIYKGIIRCNLYIIIIKALNCWIIFNSSVNECNNCEVNKIYSKYFTSEDDGTMFLFKNTLKSEVQYFFFNNFKIVLVFMIARTFWIIEALISWTAWIPFPHARHFRFMLNLSSVHSADVQTGKIVGTNYWSMLDAMRPYIILMIWYDVMYTR